MNQLNSAESAMLDTYGYIDRRVQAGLAPEDRLAPLSEDTSSDRGCPGCAGSPCPCARHSTGSQRLSETLRRAQTWETVKSAYKADGFCEPCSVQAAYGHQIGFSVVAPACPKCTGKRPTYRHAGEQALRWAGSTPEPVLVTGEALSTSERLA